MRLLAITTFLLLALAGLALVPAGSAAPPQPPCNGTIAATKTVGPVTVFASPPCYTVSIDAMSCPIAGSWKDVAHVQQVTVRAYTCDSPDPTADASAAQVPPCACPPPPPPPRCVGFDTVGVIAQVVRLTGDESCNITVYVLPLVACAGDPLDGSKSITYGKVTVVLPCGQIDYCEAPFDCPPASAHVPPALAICNTPDLCNDAGCPYPVGADGGMDLRAGPVSVHNDCGPQDLCSGPFRCTSPIGPTGAASIPPVCIEREASTGVAKAGVDSCRQDHETTCTASPQRIHRYEEVAGGLAYAQVDFCLPHMPPPSPSTASNPGPCGVGPQRCPAPVPLCSGISGRVDDAEAAVSGVPVGVGVSSGCHADLYLPPLTGCTWSGSYKPEASEGPVTVWAWSCDPETSAASASAATLPVQVHPVVSTDPVHVDLYVKADVVDCIWGEDYNPTPVGPALTVWVWGCRPPYPPPQDASTAPPCICPPPKPLCYDLNRAVAWGDIVRVDDYCNAFVTLDAYCGLQGTPENHYQNVSKVHVRYQTCQGPPPASAGLANPFPTCVRECSPLPDQACALRDATPSTLQHPLWGYDCTLDVETSCVEGSDGATEANVGFVHVSLAHCSGGPDPA
jgi:hypothetical protein